MRHFITTLKRPLVTAALVAIGLVSGNAQDTTETPNAITLATGKSVLVNSAEPIERVAVGFGDVAEATTVSPREVLVNAKAPGSTSLIIWQKGGGKLFFDVNVAANRFVLNNRVESIRRELTKELPDQNITFAVDNDIFYLRGTAKDLTSADRAFQIASSVGKVVNLLYVQVPKADPQILLKVRFASLDRTRSQQFGFNLFSTGATNTIGAIGTTQFPAPSLPTSPNPQNLTNPFVFSDLLNLFLFRKDLNLGATLKDLEVKGILQTLAEPNVLAENDKQASFLAGGEFPYPVFQGSSGGTGAVTIQFREFGVRLNFIPTITPRGTIRLQVAPEVSSLDFTNGLTIQGFNVPALTTRKVKTEVELQEGQSFAIGGLLDKRVTKSFQKMPFIGDIPILGKLFQSESVNRQNTELVVIVTPELVQPIPAGAPIPEIKYPETFIKSENGNSVRTPGIATTGTAPNPAAGNAIPVEKLVQSLQPEKPLNVNSTSSVMANAPSGQQQDTVFTSTAIPAPQ